MSKTRVIALSIAIFIIALMYTPLIQYLASPLIAKDRLIHADAIIILSGGWENKNKLSKSTLERYNYGIKLFQRGYGKYIIFSGGNLRGNPSEAGEMAQMAISNGFPEESVLAETNSESTWENALFVKKVMLDMKLKSAILVTSPYHSLRAKEMFTAKGVAAISAPVPNSEFYNATGVENLKMAKLVLLEYLKLALFKVNILL